MRLLRLRRAVALSLALANCLIDLGRIRMRGRLTGEQRAHWLHVSCRRVLSGLGIRYSAEGPLPVRGVVVANHLSYLDILIFGAAIPCFFVSKIEVARWPLFGFAARTGGTIFIDRSSRASARIVARQIVRRFRLRIPVLFFPEGTSTNGEAVLPFYSGLFESAVRAAEPVTAAAVCYVLENGRPEQELCWFGDDAFLPHLWRALGTPGFRALIRFGESQIYADRRTAATTTRAQIVDMRESMRCATNMR